MSDAAKKELKLEALKTIETLVGAARDLVEEAGRNIRASGLTQASNHHKATRQRRR